jgi:hypothetical protein
VQGGEVVAVKGDVERPDLRWAAVGMNGGEAGGDADGEGHATAFDADEGRP